MNNLKILKKIKIKLKNKFFLYIEFQKTNTVVIEDKPNNNNHLKTPLNKKL